MQNHVHQRKPVASKRRSRDGCWTCRLRKVKCDEVGPICGSCRKSKKDCIWGQRWKFADLKLAIRRNYNSVSRAECSAGSIGTRPRSSTKPIRLVDGNGSPAEIKTKEETLPCLHQTFNIVLTPKSFCPLTPSDERAVELAVDDYEAYSIPRMDSSDDPDIIFLHDLGGTDLIPTSSTTYATRMSGNNTEFPIQPLGHILDSSAQEDHYDDHFKTLIAKILIPHDANSQRADNDGPGSAIVSHSKTWIPLHHAICAISSLTLALDGQPNLLAQSFRHYGDAIKVCIADGEGPSAKLPLTASLYLHFILLLFDTCCASRGFLPEKQVWTAHVNQLARLAYQLDLVDDSQASLLWYTFQLDLNSSLAGDSEAGSFVRAYKTNEHLLPFRYRPRSFSAKLKNKSYDATAYNHCLGIENFICTKLADLSQLATETRARVELDPASSADVQNHIVRFADQLQRCWQQKLWRFLSVSLSRVEPSLASRIKTIYDRSSIQYSTAMLYLYTSMYAGQYCHIPVAQHSDIARHSKHILYLASEMVGTSSSGQCHLVLPTFLAGIVSCSSQDRAVCRALCHALKDGCFNLNIDKVEALLDKEYSRHTCRSGKQGTCSRGTDWISLARECGIMDVSLGV